MAIIPVRFEIEIPVAGEPKPWEHSRLVIVNEVTGERKTVVSASVKEGREWEHLTYLLERGLREVSLQYD